MAFYRFYSRCTGSSFVLIANSSWFIAFLFLLMSDSNPTLAQCLVNETAMFQLQDPQPSDLFGSKVAASGDRIVVGAPLSDCTSIPDCGSATVYRFDGFQWIIEQELHASDPSSYTGFGQVAISGGVIAVGAPLDYCGAGYACGATYVFRFDGSIWVQEQKLIASDAAAESIFGSSVSLDENLLLIGAQEASCTSGDDCGAAYVFRFNGSSWIEEQKLTASDAKADDRFGSVAVDGNVAVVGAGRANCGNSIACGAAYVYEFNGLQWNETQRLTDLQPELGDWFGNSVAVSGDLIVIGAYSDDCAVGFGCGSTTVFRHAGNVWVREAKLFASDAGLGENFGDSVSANGNRILVGAPRDSCSTGIDCGAAYMFGFDGDKWHEQAKFTDSRMTRGWLGSSVALDRNTVVAGAPVHGCDGGIYCGAAYAYRLPNCDLDPAPNHCVCAVPAASVWGLIVFALLVLAYSKVKFSPNIINN